jgi:anti-anti-sigma factor
MLYEPIGECMSFQVISEQTGDVAILQCQGRLVRGEAIFTLREAVTAFPDARILVLDLTGVQTMDGGGLGMLTMLHRWTRDHGTALKLVNPNPFVRELLQRTHLVCVFDISSVEDVVDILCTSEEAAVPATSSQIARAVA